MLRELKFPLIYALELLLWAPLLAAFYGTVSFLASVPIYTIALEGKSLPKNWEAAIQNHGKYLQGFLIAKHPFAFSFILATLLGTAFLMYLVHKAQSAQRLAVGESGASVHKVAQACVIAILASVGYLALSFLLVGKSAA